MGEVAHVINGKSFVLASGETVRIASIEVPNIYEPGNGTHGAYIGEPLGAEAKAALEKLLMHHKVRVETVLNKPDRHNRIIGKVYRDDGLCIEEELLKEGWAMVYSFPEDSPSFIEKMRTAERKAQKAKAGIWSQPYFRVITPPETQEFVGRFKLVEGKVVSVNEYHGHIYINFTDRWKGNFAVFISRKYAADFASMHLPELVGKTIRVRGFITYHNAPNIDVTHPAQIEVE